MKFDGRKEEREEGMKEKTDAAMATMVEEGEKEEAGELLRNHLRM